MRILPMTALAAALLGLTIGSPLFAAQPYTGCPAGYHRAEAEGGGVGSVNLATRKAEAEGGGVDSVNLATRKTEAQTAQADRPCVQ